MAFCYKTLEKDHGQICTRTHPPPPPPTCSAPKPFIQMEKAVTGDYKDSSMQHSFSQGLQNQHTTNISTRGKRCVCKLNGAVGHLSWGRELPWMHISQLKDSLTWGNKLACTVIRSKNLWFTGSLQGALAYYMLHDNKSCLPVAGIVCGKCSQDL